MILLSLLFNLIFSPTIRADVSIEFQFKSMSMGQPPMKMYYYDLTLKNTFDKTFYVLIPCSFDNPTPGNGKVWGAQFDDFGSVEGSTLFAEEKVTIFKLGPKQEIKAESYEIKSFQDKILSEDQTIIVYTTENVTVGGNSLESFMSNNNIHDDNLPFALDKPSKNTVLVKVR